MPGTHNHAHISIGITSTLREWCVILDGVVVFVTDNGSNVKKFVKLKIVITLCRPYTYCSLSVQKAFVIPEVQTAIS